MGLLNLFKKRKENPLEQLVKSHSDQCIDQIAQKWLHYNQMIQFKPEVPLTEIIESFAMPMQEFVKNTYPILYPAGPGLFWMMVFRGIQKTKYPSLDAVNNAINELDKKFRNAN